jgi:peptide deformylase
MAEATTERDGDARLSAEAEARRRIALAQIRQWPDAVLRMRANEVREFDEELERLAERMRDLMHDARGVGLAATQVGILRRVIVFSDEDEDLAVANPRIVDPSTATETDEEGCLSLGPVRVPVERAVSLTLEGQDLAGEPFTLKLEGLSARVVQHEVDHLDGVLIVQRTNDASRREALAALRPQPVLGTR